MSISTPYVFFITPLREYLGERRLSIWKKASALSKKFAYLLEGHPSGTLLIVGDAFNVSLRHSKSTARIER